MCRHVERISWQNEKDSETEEGDQVMNYDPDNYLVTICVVFVAAQFLLDLIEMRDNFRHSGSFLSFNEVYDIIVHLATQ